MSAPLILVIDDMFGRQVGSGVNRDRQHLCSHLLLQDVTGDSSAPITSVRQPIADAVFHRGQTPRRAQVGDTVSNDPAGILEIVRNGWLKPWDGARYWSLVLLDLSFLTGPVTSRSNTEFEGMPEGEPQDHSPTSYFGLAVLELLRTHAPDLPVIILSSKFRVDVEQDISELGALAFIPRTDANATDLLRTYLDRHGLMADATGTVIGRSKACLRTLRDCRRHADSGRNVLIAGPPGTNRTALARLIHSRTAQRAGVARPFHAVDCRTGSVFEISDLRGPDRRVRERVALPRRGDLLLDGFEGLERDVRLELVQRYESTENSLLDRSDARWSGVRLLGSLSAAGSEARFEDRSLFPDGIAVTVSALRDRREDIPGLCEAILAEHRKASARTSRVRLSPSALALLEDHLWPRNEHELHQVLLRALSGAPDLDHLTEAHIAPLLRANLQDDAATGSPRTPRRGAARLAERFKEAERTRAEQTMQVIAAALARASKLESGGRELQLRPAIREVTGITDLSTTDAAAWLKRWHKSLGEYAYIAESDEFVTKALEMARRLRPKQSNRED